MNALDTYEKARDNDVELAFENVLRKGLGDEAVRRIMGRILSK